MDFTGTSLLQSALTVPVGQDYSGWHSADNVLGHRKTDLPS